VTCRVISAPGGISGFACSRGRRAPAKPEPRRFCVACLSSETRTPAFHLCDFPRSWSDSSGGEPTCDKAMCDAHRRAIRPGVDWCQDHAGVTT
jgi:hypothetical protein